MRTYSSIILTLFILSIFSFVIILKLDSKKSSTPFYYFPNGFIANTSAEYSNLLGKRIYISQVSFSEKQFKSTGESIYDIYIIDKNHDFQILSVNFTDKTKWKILYDFLPFILLSCISMFVSIWFFLQDRDIHIFFLFSSIASAIFSSFIVLAYNDLYTPFYFTLFLIPCFILNISFRLNGQEISAKWIVVEIIFAFILSFIGYSEKEDPLIFENLTNFAIYLILIFSFVFIIIVLYDLLKYGSGFSILLKKLSLVFSIILISFLPFWIFNYDIGIFQNYSQNILFVSFLLFPVLFIYGTYRYTFIPVQLFFSNSLTTAYLISFFLLMYLTFYFLLTTFKPLFFHHIRSAFNICYIFLSMLLLPLAKEKLSDWIDYWTFKRNQKLNHSLKELADLISNPISLKGTISSLISKIMKTLEVGKIIVLIPGERFPKMELGKISLMRIPFDSEIWKYFSSEFQITVTSYLTYGVGIRESVYEFLRDLEIQLAYPMISSNGKKVESVFLVGEKLNRKNFSLGELRYIKECTRFANLLLENYTLLNEEVEKKKLVRELNFASIVDNIIHPLNDTNISGIGLSYLAIPAVGISGDYLEIVKLSETKMLILLGDVAGHGLGSGYIVSAIKAITRQNLKADLNIEKLFSQISDFLIERYSGNEFLTLIGGIMDIETGIFSYANAGHLPLIILRKSKEVEVVSESQRVLGIRHTQYDLREIKIFPSEKLILFSDGVTETFNKEEETYGEEKFITFLKENSEKSPKQIVTLLTHELKNFRNGVDISDDISVICISIENLARPLK
ncbi:MAG: serine/threonine-protein phosphatase [Leptospiraceae bacterium]|nr:SpoIIE family protein phosphatase [Leptospiraceae bacterium]MCK6382380.1 serine/threonine-protein phosphatase [Leptospiraceae bacterium]NUM41177.1 SpoIIE family protein phosphatase [Leptospiraceae bacterium]